MSLPDTIKLGNKSVAVPVTIADQVVNWLNPAAGQKRYQARARMALVTGGYDSADKSRRANQKGGRREMDADSAILPDLVTLREDSQHLARNNSLACGALKTNVTKIVGTGLQVKAQIDRDVLNLSDERADAWERSAEREFRLATDTRELDAERQLPFSLLQGLAFLRVLEDGDVLVNMPRFARPGSPYKLKLQLIEAARLCNPQFNPDTDRLTAGVARDKYGGPVKYHVVNTHPGNLRYAFLRRNSKKYSWQTLRAFAQSGEPLALHLFDKTRPGQTRGVPYLAPVIELIRQLGRYTDAEVMAAVVTGMLTVFVRNETGNPDFGPAPDMDNPTSDPTAQADDTGLELGYGSVVGLPDGTSIETVDPNRPNAAFDPFFIAITRQIGMALELPFEVLIKHFTSSYSASRAALEDAWDYFMRRRTWLACQFCQPVYEAVITEAVISGRLAAPGFFTDPLIKKAWLGSLWTGDAPNQIDPVKEIEAAKRRIALRISTRTEERARLLGGDLEAIQPQIIKEQKWLVDNELLAQSEAPSAARKLDGDGQSGGSLEVDVDLKKMADTYGVGVRAGIVTPQIDDEVHFRDQVGLPEINKKIIEAWEADGGVRRPITIKSEAACEGEQNSVVVNNEDADG